MLAGIRDILIISTPEDSRCSAPARRRLRVRVELHLCRAGTAARAGGRIHRRARFCRQRSVALVLGDNIFHGHGLPEHARAGGRARRRDGFGYSVNTPEQYGVVELDDDGRALSIEEKPTHAEIEPRRDRTVFLRQRRLDIAAAMKPSPRGEIEITDVNPPISIAASCTSRCWAAALPGSTPEPMPRWSKPAIRADPGRAAGPADRLPGGDRVAAGLYYARAFDEARATPPRAATANI